MPKKILRPWTDPAISPKNTTAQTVGHHCYVWFRFFDPEKGEWTHPVKRKPLLVHPYSKRDHYQELKALVKAIDYKLNVEGWNPVTNSSAPAKFEDLPVDDQITRAKYFTFKEAIDFAFEKKKADWSSRSADCYKSVVKFLKDAAGTLKLLHKPMSEFELPHFKALLDETRKSRKLSSIGFNKYREYLSSLVSEMIQWQIVKINLVHHIKTKIQDKHNAHRPPTADERSQIITHIKNTAPNYYRFLSVLYGCAIRPDEITRLQVKHLHKKEGVFRIPAAGTKTKEYREAVIPDWVMDLLMELNLQNHDTNHYIFSAASSWRSREHSFRPGPKKMHTHTTTRWWREIVKEKKGLGIDVSQYSLKKLSGNDMVRLQVLNNMDNLLELPRQQMGHANQSMTEVYVDEHKVVNKELIRKMMPVL
ncbi:MAG: site-specific integrase [Chitinophagaceae bacterium]